ncbi:hypothetical protein [Sphaerisporangium perillae]|uniref:hypothetical protein n=1 Tax=Sphaerisporangium perillae TaxID=2935860 RepID=UPI00200DC68A|nr:hypothetical protein [Sphaerisporangium perillae]
MPRLYHLIAGLSALGSLALPMHPHPTGSTDRVTPGTVRVEAKVHVSINLLDDRGVIQQVVREYDTPVGTGSGFTVSPDGVVVTATGVVRSGKDPSVYAANRVFAEYFKVKIPADFSKHKLKDPDLNGRLQRCYPPQRQDSTCIASAATLVTVFPYADPPTPEGYPAELLHAGTSPGAPAVLKLTKGGEDGTLPTVPLGTTLGSGIESVDTIGLPTRPSAKSPPKVETAHLDPPGGRTFKPAERAKLNAFLKNDGDGGAVIDDGKSEVIGFVTGAGGTAATLTPVDDVRAALVAADVTARRGPVDVVYETALAPYHNKFYANAIPVLEQVLRLRPDHAVAQDHLRFARANRAGTPSTGQTKAPAAQKVATGLSPLLLTSIGIVAAAAVVATTVPLMLRRRRRAGGEAAGGTAEAVPVVSGASTWPPRGTQTMEAVPSGGSFPSYRQAPDRGHGTGPSPVPVAAPGATGGIGGMAAAPGTEPGAPESRPPVPAAGGGPDGRGANGVPDARAAAGAPEHAAGGQGQVQFCTQCGMRLGKAHRFCGFCGSPVDQ